MAQESRPALFMGALIGSAIGYLLLVFGTFGGWYNYDYYNGIQVWGYVGGFGAPIAIPILAALGLPLLGCASLSMRAIQNPAAVTRQKATLALVLASTQMVILAVGGIAFAALTSGNTSWWFDVGFYGPLIGTLLAIICLFAVRGTYAAAAPGVAPPPAYAAPGYPQGPYMPAPPPDMQNPQPASPTPPTYAPPTYPQGGYAQPAPPPMPTPPVAQAPPGYAQPYYPQSYPPSVPYPPSPSPAPMPPPPPAGGPRFCVRCGAQAAPDQRFCARCGSPV